MIFDSIKSDAHDREQDILQIMQELNCEYSIIHSWIDEFDLEFGVLDYTTMPHSVAVMTLLRQVKLSLADFLNSYKK